jgi:predicted MFS family arabinose efflux permease
VWIDAASFFVAAGIEATIHSNFRVGEPEPGGLQIRSQIKKAFRFVRANRSLAVLLLTGFGNSFGFGVVIGLLVPYAVQRLALPDDGGRLGLIYSATGVGALVAGLMFARIFAPRRVRWMSPGTVLVAALTVTGLTLATNWVVAAILLVVFAWANGVTVTSGITYRQLATPDSLRSSVNVFGRMVSWGGQPFGAATGSLVAAHASVRSAYIVAAVVLYTTATVALVLFQPSTEIRVAEL